MGFILVSQIFIPSISKAIEDPFNTNQQSSIYMLAQNHGEHGMKKMDTDGDGEISREEFMAHKEMCFMKKDINGDGKLTADEMKKGKHKKHMHGDKNK